MTRITPFELVFGEFADDRFPALKASLGAAGIDPLDRDAFLLDQAVTEFLRDLVPEDAPPASLHEFIAVLQHSYLYWDAGQHVTTVGTMTPPPDAPIAPHAPTRPAYLQLPSHLYWGQLEPDAPHEPLDGFFLHALGDGISALGVFGVHRERPGFTVSEVRGRASVPLAPRADGSAPFAPLMDGGAAAGLRSVAGPEELLALAWHSLESVAAR